MRATHVCSQGMVLSVTVLIGTMAHVDSLRAQNENKPIAPASFPDVDIKGFQFPERADVIDGWLLDLTSKNAATAREKIRQHTWGLWVGLTQETDQVYDGQKLRVFETWFTPGDILNGARLDALIERNPRKLQPLRQISGHRDVKAVGDALTASQESSVLGLVKYSPAASEHIIQNDLFSGQALTTLLRAGEDEIPTFPPEAIVLKPVFQPLPSSKLIDGRYIQVPVWPGPPGDTPPGPPIPFPPTAWHSCVWIDLKNEAKGDGSVDTACKKDGSSRTPQDTYNVSDFINFQISAADAAAFNKNNSGPHVDGGDYFVLMGMHATSREVTRWTWQTFWWSAHPDKPHFPSSQEIAQTRPEELTGAPRHYAAAIAYSMLVPIQPVTGGENFGNSVYAYNPYLEAQFSRSDLPDSVPGTYEGRVVANTVGIHTNCMSCHGRANYNPFKLNSAPNYTGVRYINLDDPRFRGTLRVDFLWSIPANVKSSKSKSPPTKQKP